MLYGRPLGSLKIGIYFIMSRDYINKVGCFNSFEEAYDSVFPGVDHDDIYAASLQDMAENYGIDTGNNFYMHVENFLPNDDFLDLMLDYYVDEIGCEGDGYTPVYIWGGDMYFLRRG